jgi:hypothetical protein
LTNSSNFDYISFLQRLDVAPNMSEFPSLKRRMSGFLASFEDIRIIPSDKCSIVSTIDDDALAALSLTFELDTIIMRFEDGMESYFVSIELLIMLEFLKDHDIPDVLTTSSLDDAVEIMFAQERNSRLGLIGGSSAEQIINILKKNVVMDPIKVVNLPASDSSQIMNAVVHAVPDDLFPYTERSWKQFVTSLNKAICCQLVKVLYSYQRSKLSSPSKAG